jgi:hypothetical protein
MQRIGQKRDKKPKEKLKKKRFLLSAFDRGFTNQALA